MQTAQFNIPEVSKTTILNLSTLSEDIEHDLRATIKQLNSQIKQVTASKEALRL